MKKIFFILIIQIFISSQLFADAKTDLAKNIKDYEKLILNDQSNYFVSSDEPAEKMRVLGWHNFSGEKGIKNYDRAIMWFELASKYYHPTGAYHLGLFHYSGIAGLEQDFEKAHYYFVLAYEHWTKGDFRFGMSLEDFTNDMNRYNPKPKKEFSNLRDLFVKAIDRPTQNNYLNLKNLTNNIQMVTVVDFLNSEKKEAFCSDDEGEERKLKIYASGQNDYILRAIMPVLEDILTEEEFLLSYAYAKNIDDVLEWFEFSENEFFGDYLNHYKFYSDINSKQLKLVQQPYDIVSNADIYLETFNKYELLKKEKLLDIGGVEHIALEMDFHEYLSANYQKLNKSIHEGSIHTFNFICEM